jgi:hypothetical protein
MERGGVAGGALIAEALQRVGARVRHDTRVREITRRG